MESADTTSPADRTTPRRWRRLGFVLVILVAMEAAGWIGDHLLDFRQKLLWRLTLMEVEAAPVGRAPPADSRDLSRIARAADLRAGWIGGVRIPVPLR